MKNFISSIVCFFLLSCGGGGGGSVDDNPYIDRQSVLIEFFGGQVDIDLSETGKHVYFNKTIEAMEKVNDGLSCDFGLTNSTQINHYEIGESENLDVGNNISRIKKCSSGSFSMKAGGSMVDGQSSFFIIKNDDGFETLLTYGIAPKDDPSFSIQTVFVIYTNIGLGYEKVVLDHVGNKFLVSKEDYNENGIYTFQSGNDFGFDAGKTIDGCKLHKSKQIANGIYYNLVVCPKVGLVEVLTNE